MDGYDLLGMRDPFEKIQDAVGKAAIGMGAWIGMYGVLRSFGVGRGSGGAEIATKTGYTSTKYEPHIVTSRYGPSGEFGRVVGGGGVTRTEAVYDYGHFGGFGGSGAQVWGWMGKPKADRYIGVRW